MNTRRHSGVPVAAFRRRLPELDDFEPPDDTSMYRDYKFLGRYKAAETDLESEVLARAKADHGSDTKVFWTARYWVAYRLL
jgi:hypothetical protein